MTALASAFLLAAAAWLVIPSPRDSRAARAIRGARAAELPGRAPLAGALGRIRPGFGPGARRRAARERSRTVQALGALAAELESGQPPPAALVAAGGQPSVWPTAAAAAALGEDVASALLRDAQSRPGLRMLAACWQVSSETGTGFASSVRRLAHASRAQESVRVELEGELAAPRATARLLATLPVIGLGFGVLLGTDPVSWLLRSPPGLACLAVGLALTTLGALWTARIAAGVERLL